MVTTIILSGIIAQTAIAIYAFNILRLREGFEHVLNVLMVILFFHLSTKLFILTVLKDTFLYNYNATGFSMSYGPLLYMTTLVFLQQRPGIRSIMLHMLPFVLLTLMFFSGSACYILHILPGSLITSYDSWYHWLVASSLFIYPALVLRLLYKASVLKPAGIKMTVIKLLRQMAYIMMAGNIVGLVLMITRVIRTGLYNFDMRLVPYICFLPLPILILHYKINAVSKQPPVPIPVPVPAPVPEEAAPLADAGSPKQKQYKKSAVGEDMMRGYELSLINFMEKSKIYLEPGVSLEELSERSNIPKHHLTQLLNERFEKNFYTFLNEYRINEAIERLKNPDVEVSILSLAYDCGFNSKSSFNNYFKKVTNLTPSAYRKVQVPTSSEQDELVS